ncbi:MAG TPA: universal stress protein [Acidisoma sp.]|jgi:nucleotide-binding universal stress UspA family protein|uniref:universal stress protein n=1 Tax=Acidisoma sp. TaxID=1872115 RepID=UPI002CF946DE|nr:universal stress protein [Acidisoma sp.]HTI00654.1 universal stress protein [Acidisoma sp.]
MSLTSILLALQPGQDNRPLLDAAAALAARFGAHVEGIMLAQPLRISASEAYLASDLAVEDRSLRLEQMTTAEAAFRAALQGHAPTIAWHAEVTTADVATAIGDHARASDLVMTASDSPHGLSDAPPAFRVGDLIMQAGRPVLLVPATGASTNLNHALVAWKDAAPARRALADSLPLLRKCRQVTVTEIVHEAQLPEARRRLRLIAGWLARHGIEARQYPAASVGDDGGRLQQIATEQKASLLVAGAYAHSRMQEWIFGGVTRTLLSHAKLCTILSH